MDQKDRYQRQYAGYAQNGFFFEKRSDFFSHENVPFFPVSIFLSTVTYYTAETLENQGENGVFHLVFLWRKNVFWGWAQRGYFFPGRGGLRLRLAGTLG
ncbi:hypothetical protein H9X84_05635 [Anaerotignum lactatifermentans]|uniref:Uncharacterized protein n=1 Tax=Anaerotignum lactatifermentans TaxID=160404 RepID=A0ABS2G726_9FIRM|nr:hypothetical protein [Anaerotignum lactatifermentans]MBM6877281.1 hypothetical protein [Anaerotignum lactatifermentans]